MGAAELSGIRVQSLRRPPTGVIAPNRLRMNDVKNSDGSTTSAELRWGFPQACAAIGSNRPVGWTGVASVAAVASKGGNETCREGQVVHFSVSGRWTAAPGHVGPQTCCASGNSRPVLSNCHQRARHTSHGSTSVVRESGRQVHHSPQPFPPHQRALNRIPLCDDRTAAQFCRRRQPRTEQRVLSVGWIDCFAGTRHKK